MIKSGSFRKILCLIGIIISATVILAAFGRMARNVSKPNVAEVVFLGDSIYGNYRGDSSISGVFGYRAGVSTLNVGMGGTTAALTQDSPRSEIPEDSVALVSIAEAIYSNDYSIQHSAMPTRRCGALTYFPMVIDEIEAVDLSKAKLFIVEQALNDYFYGWPIDDTDKNDGEYDLHSYYGSISYSIELIKAKYPDAKILLVSPVYGQADLNDYAKMGQKIAKEQDIYFFDAFNANIITPDNYEELTEDGVHLNENGRELYADSLYNYCVETGLL